MCEICSKLTKKTAEQLQCRCAGVFIVNFEQTLQLVLVSLWTTERSEAQPGSPQTSKMESFPTIMIG